MTTPPPDQRLIDFLRQYQPLPSAAHPELEEQLMSALSETTAASSPSSLPWGYQQLALPALLLTGLLTLTAVHIWRQPKFSHAEQKDLELFVTETWTRTYSDFPINDFSTSETSSTDVGWLLPSPTDIAAD